MARNGSGTYTKVNTFTAGATITAASHNQNWDDIASEITNSVAADGQTTLTGPLKAASGSATNPGISFGSDTNSGLYRIGSDNIGLALNGVKAVDFSTLGVSITGTLSASGAVTVGGALTVTGSASYGDGTVLLPGISFGADLDSGFYRIGANNIGLALNGVKAADFSTAGLAITGTLSSSGALTVASGGLTVTAGGFTVTAGGLTVTAGSVSFPAGSIANAALVSPPTFTLEYTSADTAIVYGGTGSFSHGLGVIPKLLQVFLICQTTEAGYSPGDVVAYGYSEMSFTLTSSAAAWAITNGAFDLPNKSSGVFTNLTAANWKFRLKAFA